MDVSYKIQASLRCSLDSRALPGPRLKPDSSSDPFLLSFFPCPSCFHTLPSPESPPHQGICTGRRPGPPVCQASSLLVPLMSTLGEGVLRVEKRAKSIPTLQYPAEDVTEKVEHDVGFLEAKSKKCFQGAAVSEPTEGLSQLKTEN